MPLTIRLPASCLTLIAVLLINLSVLFAPTDETESRLLAALPVDSHAYVMASAHDVLPPSVEQQQEDLDSFEANNLLIQEKVPCGRYKCFYPLKSNPSVGYLVTPIGRKLVTKQQKRLGFSWFVKSWQYAQHLEKEYNISHFLLEPPVKVKLSQKLATRLNTNIFERKARYKKRAKVGIQKVKIAKESHHLLLGTRPWKRKTFLRHFDDYFFASIQDTEMFATNFRRNMKKTRKLLEKEPCFMDDFQVFVDTSGNFHHLDFERCFPPVIDEEKEEECLYSLDKIEQHVRRALRDKARST